MLFNSSDFLADFERITRGLTLAPDTDPLRRDSLGEMVEGLSQNLSKNFSAGFVGGPGVDAVNTPSAFELHIDLPGVDPVDVDVTVDGHNVTIEASRSFDPGAQAEIVHSGRRHGSLSRTFALAQDLDPEQLSARSEHGVLVISVPRTPSATPRKVQIDTAD